MLFERSVEKRLNDHRGVKRTNTCEYNMLLFVTEVQRPLSRPYADTTYRSAHRIDVYYTDSGVRVGEEEEGEVEEHQGIKL